MFTDVNTLVDMDGNILCIHSRCRYTGRYTGRYGYNLNRVCIVNIMRDVNVNMYENV